MGNKIRQVIEGKGIKISHVILETGLAKSYFYDVMNGTSIPSLRNARLISKAIAVSLDELFPDETLIDEYADKIMSQRKGEDKA